MKKQVAGKVYGPKNTQVEIKVGIHIGRVIAGVIGHHKP
jgi:phospholipid-translocating ATPase